MSINGTEVATYLESYASTQNLQDRDAQYVFFCGHGNKKKILTITGTIDYFPRQLVVSPTLPPA